jgi:hypothetical protein
MYKSCSVLPSVTNRTLLPYLYLQVQELLSTDAPLSKDTLSKAGTVLKDAAIKLAADAAAASKSDAATAALQKEVAAAQQEGAAATAALREKVTAATQHTDELGSAVREFLLGLGESLGSGTSLHEVGPHIQLPVMLVYVLTSGAFPRVTNCTLLLYLHLQVQELLSTDAPLSKDTLSKVGTVLKSAAIKLAADAAAASNSDTAAAALREQVAAANDTVSRPTIANTELEKKAAANAQPTALLSKELRTVLTELDETLPDKVSATCSYNMLFS